MSDRAVLAAVRTRLGPDAVARLVRLRRRLWWRRAVRSGLVAVATAAALMALLQLLARALPIERASWLQGGVAVLALVAWLIDSARRRPSLVEAARLADEELGLRQRLGTALELAPHETTDRLEARQLADARDILHALDLRRAFRPSLRRRPMAIAGIGLAVTLLLVAWPNPQDDIIDQRRAAREAAEDVAERVEDLADEIAEENAQNPDPRRDELERELRELIEQLRDAGADREAALARIGSVQEALARMSDPQATERDAALSQLARSVSRAATGDEEANQDGEAEDAARDLEELGERAGSMSEAEMSTRAADLRQAAGSGAASQPAAARALAEAADALERASRSSTEADRRAAQDALDRAADALRDALNEVPVVNGLCAAG